jgi:hypothetical protein
MLCKLIKNEKYSLFIEKMNMDYSKYSIDILALQRNSRLIKTKRCSINNQNTLRNNFLRFNYLFQKSLTVLLIF